MADDQKMYYRYAKIINRYCTDKGTCEHCQFHVADEYNSYKCKLASLIPSEDFSNIKDIGDDLMMARYANLVNKHCEYDVKCEDCIFNPGDGQDCLIYRDPAHWDLK